MSDATKKWWKAAGIRAVKTIAETAAGVLSAAVVLSEVDWRVVVSSALLAGLVSLLWSIAGLPELEANDETED